MLFIIWWAVQTAALMVGMPLSFSTRSMTDSDGI
jgi:hypothetical protein